MRSRKRESATPRRAPVDLVDAPALPRHGPAGRRRRTPIHKPATAPLGCMYQSRVSSRSWRLAKSGSTIAKGDALEGEVPGGVPGIFPLVRHRDDVGGARWRQSLLRPCLRLCRRRRLRRVAGEPCRDVVMVELLRPERGRRAPGAARGAGRRRRGPPAAWHRRRRPRRGACRRPRRIRAEAGLSRGPQRAEAQTHDSPSRRARWRGGDGRAFGADAAPD